MLSLRLRLGDNGVTLVDPSISDPDYLVSQKYQ